MTETFSHVNNVAARARLLDPVQVTNAYACYSIREAGRSLGASQKTFRRAMLIHGIDPRPRGARPPGMVLTRVSRATVRRVVLRAYARSDRCPPACPYRDCQCLEVEGKCGLLEAMG